MIEGLETDFAWLAGFIDGEGSITVQSGRRQLRISIPQNDIRPLQRIYDIVQKGSIYKKGKVAYQYMLCGNVQVEDLIEKIWPYLSEPKREQIEKARASR